VLHPALSPIRGVAVRAVTRENAPGKNMAERVRVEDLSTDEQLELLERIWDNLRRTPGQVPTSAAQRRELDLRTEALDRDLSRGQPAGVPWDEVLRQLRARR
jgi:putative addiction module component (TIGR02574 family)